MNKPKRLPELIWRRAIEDPLQPFVSGGGKQIRASLLRLSFQIAGGSGSVPEDLTAAIETLHAGSLVIDDIEDGSTQRRGQPCLHLRLGVPVAINAGTHMYFQALAMMAKFSSQHPAGEAILHRTIDVINRCHEGQAIDLTARADQMKGCDMMPTVTAISDLKTGELTALATWIGATVAESDAALSGALTRFGHQVGVCLQQHNDLDELDRFVNGGDRGDDLRNARVTWPWAWASQRMSAPLLRHLQSRYARAIRNHHGMLDVAAALLDEVGAFGRQEVTRSLDQQLRLLAEHVDSLELIEELTTALAPLRRTPRPSQRQMPRQSGAQPRGPHVNVT